MHTYTIKQLEQRNAVFLEKIMEYEKRIAELESENTRIRDAAELVIRDDPLWDGTPTQKLAQALKEGDDE